MPSVILHGYRFSVYTRIVRVVLEEKGVAYTVREVNPFNAKGDENNPNLHPFGRVPVFTHDGFSLYETSAIERYIDAAFKGPHLTPRLPAAVARMAQVIAIVDTYGYRPMVRQVFEHRVFRPQAGEEPSEPEIGSGLVASRKVLAALEAIAVEKQVIAEGRFSLADCHLAPMISYFTAAPEGADLLGRFPALSDWWAEMVRRPSLVHTNPGFPDPSHPDGPA